jgi:hypothetical protein
MTWRALSIRRYIAAPGFREILYQLYDEHVDGRGLHSSTL